MLMKKRAVIISLLIACALFLFGCGEEEELANKSGHDNSEPTIITGEIYDDDNDLLYKGEMYEGEPFHIVVPDIEPRTLPGSGKVYTPHGQGEYYVDGKIYYDANWEHGILHGKGTEYDTTTGVKKYEGEYNYGRRSGAGTSYHRNGEKRYEGEWGPHSIAGYPTYNGYGKEFDEDGNLIFEGYFRDGKPDNKVIINE